jgi:hypothetical protein
VLKSATSKALKAKKELSKNDHEVLEKKKSMQEKAKAVNTADAIPDTDLAYFSTGSIL